MKNLAVDQPILNSPFEEPARYWVYREGQPYVQNGRRRAGYYLKARTRADERQLSLMAEEEFVELEVVNLIRQRVKQWREEGYPGVTPVTRRLLSHWNRPERERRLFFCQLEAAETIIWLTEVYPSNRRGLAIPKDHPVDAESLARGYGPLRRYGIKMATGSGKTVVMAMIAAWSILNKVQNGQDKRFSDAVLVVCPNLTVKERLGGSLGVQIEERLMEMDELPDEDRAGVGGPAALRRGSGQAVLERKEPERALIPGARGNYYERFDLVPRSLLDALGRGRVLITNWHAFLPVDDSRSRSIVQRGAESDKAFVSRVLRELGGKKNILTLNDEGHHAYRSAPYEVDESLLDFKSAEEKRRFIQDKEEATIWVQGLDRINAARGINFVVDLSATPFYIHGSGYEEGAPFPWLVSDFGLVDAIESGIVKIPRVPVADDTGQPLPKYFRLWHWINAQLPAREQERARRKAKPESVLREADDAIQQIAGEWKRTFEEWQAQDYGVPPALIIVCDNTNLAELIYDYIAVQGRVFPELLQNQPDREVTLRIDTKALEAAELETGSGGRAEAIEELRRKVATVGKVGEPGGQIRCVVSVGMLTEGWDAHNVTQVLGLRAFQSQLLCEQVVGRGLRRVNYDDFGQEEYVDVYGIPFEVIPTKKKRGGAPTPTKESTLVKAMPERKHLRIEFPRVEGYVFAVRDRIRIDVDEVPPVHIEPGKAPTETVVAPRIGFQTGAPGMATPGEMVTQTRQAFYESIREQQIHYFIAQRVTMQLVQRTDMGIRSRHTLFPQVLAAVREYVAKRVQYDGADRREIGLEKYVQQITERVVSAVRPDTGAGEPPLLPRIERFRPRGSTDEVLFRTVRDCRPTVKSHVSHVPLDNRTWESSVAFHLEQSDLVEAYVKNEGMDFTIPYQWNGADHDYRPDYLVRLTDGTHVILEVKGHEDDQDRAKHAAAQQWAEAVTNWGEMGRWKFVVCKEPRKVRSLLAGLVAET